MTNSRVCIIGAGLAGLSAAYDLGRQGYRVLVVEGAPDVGGLASSLTIDGRPIERFYHFLCRGDDDLVALADELGVADRLHWRQTRTSFLFDGELFGFGNPFDLLRFHPVPFTQRLRFGINIISSRFRHSWRLLDAIPARTWLIKQIGERAYDVIWDPLLRVKFGDAHDQVSAAWIWHRIHRIATSRRRLWEREHLGYLELGSSTIIDALLNRLDRQDVELRTSTRVTRVLSESGRVSGVMVDGEHEPIACSEVVSTVALPCLADVVPDLDRGYSRRLRRVRYLGVVCGLLKLKQPLTDSFWININDPRTPFNGVIEYSNLNQHLELGGGSIVYIPEYLESSHPRFALDDDRLRSEFVDCLRCVNPHFEPSWIDQCHISRTDHAQAICTVNFLDSIPDHRAPLRGLYLTDSTQFYPEDRTISAAIRLGRQVAQMITADRDLESR